MRILWKSGPTPLSTLKIGKCYRFETAPEWNGLKIFENHTHIWMLLVFQNWTKPKVGFLKSYVTCFEKFYKKRFVINFAKSELQLYCKPKRNSETEQKRIFDFIGKKCQLTKEKSYLRFLKKRFGKEASWPFKAEKHDLKKKKNSAICFIEEHKLVIWSKCMPSYSHSQYKCLSKTFGNCASISQVIFLQKWCFKWQHSGHITTYICKTCRESQVNKQHSLRLLYFLF